jgi:hypothetical protein
LDFFADFFKVMIRELFEFYDFYCNFFLKVRTFGNEGCVDLVRKYGAKGPETDL